MDRKEEELYYRIARRGDIKQCPTDDCSYTVCTREHRCCPNHAKAELIVARECLIELVYVQPMNNEDKRQQLYRNYCEHWKLSH